MKKITVIPARIDLNKGGAKLTNTRKKVAAYARVSTLQDEQATSFEAQTEYYESYIKARPDWDFVGLYSDEGISGTNTRNRAGFNKMIKDALNGKINLIITKSISRFARNTVDTLSTIRELKAVGVEVFFEKENIYSLDSTGELLLTILSSLAQEESRSISENVKWGIRHKFKMGKVDIPNKTILGIGRDKDGKYYIIPEQADTVRLIYALFLKGESPNKIAEIMNEDGRLTVRGNKNWSATLIQRMLVNEKYKGDALLQKTYVVDFLTKETRVNKGEKTQYYIKNSHPAIIPEEEWELVQIENTRRSTKLNYSSLNPFGGKLVCGDCGGVIGAKVWHSNLPTRRTIYQCNNKFKNGCKTPHFEFDEIVAIFNKEINKKIVNKEQVLDDLDLIINTLTDMTKLNNEIVKQDEVVREIVNTIESLINDSKSTVRDVAKFEDEYNALVKEYELENKKLQELQDRLTKRESKRRELIVFKDELKGQKEIITKWNKTLFQFSVEKATVTRNKTIKFMFKG